MTKLHLVLTSALLAGAATLPGCDDPESVDPIWSEWTMPANGCEVRTLIEIGDDYRGEGRVVYDDCSVCRIELEVDPQGGNEYEIQVDGVDCQGTIDLDCELHDDELDCEDATGVRYDLERE